jgi:photosystem II stability/assembly factor-like uncharacterized protein
MVCGLSRLRLLSVLLPLVLVAPPLGGSLSARLTTPAASRQLRGTTDLLHGVACASPNTCVAVGDILQEYILNGMILRSTNGGPTWRSQNNPISGTFNLLDHVACASPSTCVVVGDGSTILRSTNGDSTWRSQPSGTRNFPQGVSCPRPSTCFAVGARGTILRSTDGGRSWRSV